MLSDFIEVLYNFVRLKQLTISLINDQRSLEEVYSSEINQLQTIALNGDNLASLQAKNWLNLANNTSYQNEPKLPNSGGSQNLQVLNNNTGNEFFNKQKLVSAFPNPATETVTFKLNISENIEEGSLIIFDTRGRIIQIIKIDDMSSKKTYFWNIKDNASGVYFYRVIGKDLSSKIQKIIVLK